MTTTKTNRVTSRVSAGPSKTAQDRRPDPTKRGTILRPPKMRSLVKADRDAAMAAAKKNVETVQALRGVIETKRASFASAAAAADAAVQGALSSHTDPKAIASATGLSVGAVRTSLTRLSRQGTVTLVKTDKGVLTSAALAEHVSGAGGGRSVHAAHLEPAASAASAASETPAAEPTAPTGTPIPRGDGRLRG